MTRSLQGKVAVVTGASSGIGRATAERLAAEGARVTLGARRADRLEAVVEGILRTGGVARAVPTDVTQPEQVERLICEALSAFGRVDILVNNAGIGYFGPVESTSIEEARHLFDVNVMGTFYGIRAAVPVMRKQGGGHIINVSSIVGKRATPGNGVYSATKFAQVALSESLRLELQSANIRVSIICPVSTITEFFDVAASRSPMRFAPVGPTYSAEHVAACILRCVHRPRVEVMVYRLTRLLVVLNALAPRLVDRILGAYWKKIRSGLNQAH